MKLKLLRFFAFLVALLLTVTLSGCGLFDDAGGSDPEANQGQPPQNPPPQNPPPQNPPPQDDCLRAASGDVVIPYTEETPVIYQDLPYCQGADWATATLENKSDGVWVISAASHMGWEKWTYMSEFTRWAFAEEMQAQNLVLLAPGDIALVPAGLVEPVWAPHYGVTAVWEIQKIFTDRLVTFGQDYIDDALMNDLNPHRRALYDCAQEAYKTVLEAVETNSSNDPLDHVQLALTTVSAGTCAASTAQADEQARATQRAAGQVVDDLPPVKTSWTQKVNTLSQQLDHTVDVGRLIAAAPSGCIYVKIRICI